MAERRNSPRVEFSVQMEVRKNGDVFQGTSVNVSESGILIETNKKLDLGDRVLIRLVLPSTKEITGTGTVVRQQEFGKEGIGFAVHWELNDDQKRTISEIIEQEIE